MMGDERWNENWHEGDEDYENYEAKRRANIDALDAAIERDPNNASLYWQRGGEKMRLGDWIHDAGDGDEDPRPEGHRIMDTGLEDVEKAITLDPTNVRYLKFHANYCYGNGRWRDAIADYERIIELEPNDPAHLFTRADWYERMQQHAQAVKGYSELIEMLNHRLDGWQVSWPDWLQEGGMRTYGANVEESGINAPYSLADVYHNRARCFLGLQQYDKAAADYTTLIEHGVTRLRMYNNVYAARARCYEMLKEYDKALADYDAAQGVTPEASYDVAKAKILKKMGNDADAIAGFTTAIERLEVQLAEIINPQPKPTRQLSREEILSMMPPQVRAAAEADPTIIERFQQRPDPMIGSSVRSMTAGLEQHNCQDGLAEQYRNRGASYTKLGQHEQAAADYSRAIELAYFQKRISDYINRGNAYRSLERYEDAIADYNVAIQQAGNPAATQEQRVAEYQRDTTSRMAQAMSALEQRVSQSGVAGPMLEQMKQMLTSLPSQIGQHFSGVPLPDSTPQLKSAYFNRGYAYSMLKRDEEAIANYDAYIALDPNEAVVYNNRGNAYKRLKQYEQAIADYTRALELDPGFHMALGNRGSTYTKMGRYDEAFADLMRALELDANGASKHYHLAYYYSQRHEGGEALPYLKRAIALDPKVRENAKDPDDFGWLVEHDPQFAAEFRRLMDE